MGANRGLLVNLAGADAGREKGIRRGRNFNTVPAARCACDPAQGRSIVERDEGNMARNTIIAVPALATLVLTDRESGENARNPY